MNRPAWIRSEGDFWYASAAGEGSELDRSRATTAEHGFETSRKRASSEGFGYEVVGTQLENPYLVVFVALGGQDHHRDLPGGRPGAQLSQDPIAVETRKIKVEDNDIGCKPIDLVQRLHSVPGLGYPVPFALEQVLHYPAQLLFVLHQQHAGTLSPPAGQDSIGDCRLFEEFHIHREVRHWSGRHSRARGRWGSRRRPAGSPPPRAGRCRLGDFGLLSRDVGDPHQLLQRRLTGKRVPQPTRKQGAHASLAGGFRDLFQARAVSNAPFQV